ncbi:hypothetical protein KX279_23920, partial [Escherichia coli]|uniref:hypothetical protein n=1 Tax=Escherichia coli TaxID=562 RepID=UPI001C57DEE5
IRSKDHVFLGVFRRFLCCLFVNEISFLVLAEFGCESLIFASYPVKGGSRDWGLIVLYKF